MKKFLHILSFLVVSNIFYAQKQENPVLKELNEIILNTKLYGGFYNGMSREAATNEYETNKYSKYYNITFPGVNHKFSLQNDPRGWDGVGEGKLNQQLGPGDRLGDPNLSTKFQTVSIIEVELFGKLYYTPTDGLIGVKLFSSEAGNANNYKESIKGILYFLSSVGYSDQIREPMSINDKRSSEQNDSHKKLIKGEYTITEGFFNDEKSIDLVFTLTKGELKIDVLLHNPSQSNGGQISILIYNSKDFDYFKHLEGIKENISSYFG
jgi:hypothetical protein